MSTRRSSCCSIRSSLALRLLALLAAATLLAACDGDGGGAGEATAAACRDGLDNDLDGYVDCADQDCGLFVFCATPGFDVSEPGADAHGGADVAPARDDARTDAGVAPDTGDDPCVPDCAGRECGDDGCGGVCGTCGEGEECSAAGRCLDGPCVPSCAAPDGSPDGCGGCCGGCVAGAALAATPTELRFQARAVGHTATLDLRLTSVGRDPVTIEGVDLLAGAGPGFALAPQGQRESGAAVPLDRPFELAPNESVTIQVSYTPPAASAPDAVTGQPIPDSATLRVHHDGADAPLDVPVSGWGVTADSPVPVVVVPEGAEVIPQTVIHLQGDQSYAGGSEITRWQWRVDQPSGSQSVFVPSPNVPNPTFEANVAGLYTFYLDVWDAQDRRSASPAMFEVVVVPDEALHIELLWTTPGDPDETDAGPFAGSDIDLHFLHPNGPSDPAAPDVDGDGQPDPYFDQPFDCYWFNPHPDWATPNPAIEDDPGLDRDDTDGAGPENINLAILEDGTRYEVAVHYWNDHAYGPSSVTLRIYIYQQLVAEKTNVRLLNYDLWHAAWIDWPTGEVTWQQGPDGGESVTPNYRHPMFFNK